MHLAEELFKQKAGVGVPTMKEAGLDYEVPFWTAIYAPIHTPKPIAEKLTAAVSKAMHDDAVIKRLAEVGTEQ